MDDYKDQFPRQVDTIKQSRRIIQSLNNGTLYPIIQFYDEVIKDHPQKGIRIIGGGGSRIDAVPFIVTKGKEQ